MTPEEVQYSSEDPRRSDSRKGGAAMPTRRKGYLRECGPDAMSSAVSALVIGGLLLASAGGARGVGQEPKGDESPVPAPRSFAVYALSRGAGVPPAARRALEQVQERVDKDRGEGIVVESRRTGIGIEGETRLCVEYEDAEPARKALERARDIVKDVDLVNLVVEPCDKSRSESEPDKEDEP
jgi:hypothetical protein